MPTDETSPAAPRVTVKLRLDRDYVSFNLMGSLTPTLGKIAAALEIPTPEISLVDLRQGCVILVLDLPAEAAARLLTIRDSRQRSAALKALADDLRVIGVDEGDEPAAVPLVGRDFSSDLSWLHISDLHLTSDYSDITSDTRSDLDRFLTDLPDLLESRGVVPDAVFFTGDIVQSGVKDEYQAAFTFLGALRNTLPFKSRAAPIYIVPGNHDTDWSAVIPKQEADLRRELAASAKGSSSTRKTAEILETNRPYIEGRQQNYLDFAAKSASEFSPGQGQSLSFVSSFSGPSRGLNISVVGLNSSLLSTNKKAMIKHYKLDPADVPDLDLQHLHLGSAQLRSLRSEIPKDASLTVALMHHPPLSEWFAETDRHLQREELTRYDFILRGHQHETHTRTGAKVAGRDDFIEIAPGALRTKPHWYQGFMTGDLDVSRGLLRVCAWTVTGSARRWVPDAEFGTEGVEIRPLPERMRKRLLAVT